MNNKWCEGKHSPTINKVKKNRLGCRIGKTFQNSLCLIRHKIAHLGNVADLGTWSGLVIFKVVSILEILIELFKEISNAVKRFGIMLIFQVLF